MHLFVFSEACLPVFLYLEHSGQTPALNRARRRLGPRCGVVTLFLRVKAFPASPAAGERDPRVFDLRARPVSSGLVSPSVISQGSARPDGDPVHRFARRRFPNPWDFRSLRRGRPFCHERVLVSHGWRAVTFEASVLPAL